jgi:hypothetical protein
MYGTLEVSLFYFLGLVLGSYPDLAPGQKVIRKAGSESGTRIPDPQHFLSALALYLFRYPDRFIFYWYVV